MLLLKCLTDPAAIYEIVKCDGVSEDQMNVTYTLQLILTNEIERDMTKRS